MIHRYWSTSIPPEEASWIKHSLETLNDDIVIDWVDDKLPMALIKFLEQHKSDVSGPYLARHRANIIRYWLLNRHGGWWVDHDVIMLKPFSELPYPLIAKHANVTCTCIMGFPENHPLLIRALNNIKPHEKSIYASGERLINSLILPEDNITALTLPFDAKGHWTGASPWAVHLYKTSGKGK